MYADLIQFIEIKRTEIKKEFELIEERIGSLKRDMQTSICEVEEKIKKLQKH